MTTNIGTLVLNFMH